MTADYNLQPDDAPSEPVVEDQEKVPQAAANYQEKGKGSIVCGNCANFEPPENCLVIQGPVAAEGTCDLFQQAGGMSQLMNELPSGVL